MVEDRGSAAASDKDWRSEREATSTDGRGDALGVADGRPWARSAVGGWPLAVSAYAVLAMEGARGVVASSFEALASDQHSEGYHIDATIMRAHQDAAGARRGGEAKLLGARAEVRPLKSMPSSTPSEIQFGSPSRKDRPRR